MARHLHVSPFPPKSSGKAPCPWTTAFGWRADELLPWGEGWWVFCHLSPRHPRLWFFASCVACFASKDKHDKNYSIQWLRKWLEVFLTRRLVLEPNLESQLLTRLFFTRNFIYWQGLHPLKRKTVWTVEPCLCVFCTLFKKTIFSPRSSPLVLTLLQFGQVHDARGTLDGKKKSFNSSE